MLFIVGHIEDDKWEILEKLMIDLVWMLNLFPFELVLEEDV
jgi:hypothetical protein